MKITKDNIQNVFNSQLLPTRKRPLDILEKNYTQQENLFCDSSGFGQPDELALTQKQLVEKIEELVSEYGTIYTYITDIGQFQVYIGVYTKNTEQIKKQDQENQDQKFIDDHFIICKPS
jgi:hypothetical protein